MSVFHNNILAGAAGSTGGAAEFKVERSLRFNSGDSSYLNRTPSSAGNRRTYTFSCWVKRSGLTAENNIFHANSASWFRFESSDKIYFWYNGSTAVYTDAVFRDPSAWYHLVLAVDTTQASASNRVKIYVNGVQQTLSGTQPSLSAQTGFNNNIAHYIGRQGHNTSNMLNGYLADVHFIDGQQLAATDFGEEDDNGVWQPKDCQSSLTYGTNGFYLKFADNSSNASLGTDSSGNSNTWTVNNLSVTAGALSASRGSNQDTESSTYSEYGTVSQASSLTLPMSNPSHYEGAALRVNSGGFKAEPTHSASTEFFMACWVKFDSLSNGNQMGVNIGGNYIYWEVRSNGDVKVRHVSPGNSGQTSNTPLSTNTWHHIALSRSGNTVTGFVDGTAVITCSAGNATNTVPAGSEFNFFGQSGTSYNMAGYLLDAVVYVGAGRTSNYTVPSSPLITSSGSINDVAGMSSSNRVYASPLISVGGGDENIDSLIDTPMGYTADSGNNGGNYCTLNPLDRQSTNGTLSNGNLDLTQSSAAWAMYRGTIAVSSGKWYYEVNIGANQYSAFGILSIDYDMGSASNNWPSQTGAGKTYALYPYNGQKYDGTQGINYATANTSPAGSVYGVAFDLDNGTITFYKDGSSLGQAFTGISGTFAPAAWLYNQSNADSYNFGQRPFAYTPPTGHKSLCTQNLDDPTIVDSSDHFDVKTYTGVETANTNITGFNFSPDFVWIKRRNGTTGHFLYDTIRGIRRSLYSNSSESENNYSDTLESFNSDGFTLGDSGFVNSNNDTYVAYAWEGASSTASNTNGSITSSVRANTSAGFSIVTWSGNSQNATVGHGLGAVPEMIWHKRRNNPAGSWIVYHKDVGNNKFLQLNATDGENQGSYFDNKSPTSTIFNVSDYDETNRTGGNYVAYCFAPVEGFSAFRSHIVGSGTNFVYLGFRPRFVMLKRTGTGSTTNMSYASWAMFDTARDTFNEVDFDTILYANRNYAEGKRGNSANSNGGSYLNIDILSNGIRFQSGAAEFSQPSDEIIICAWAEHPFKTARAR